jgi:predicted transcriptional regulator
MEKKTIHSVLRAKAKGKGKTEHQVTLNWENTDDMRMFLQKRNNYEIKVIKGNCSTRREISFSSNTTNFCVAN